MNSGRKQSRSRFPRGVTVVMAIVSVVMCVLAIVSVVFSVRRFAKVGEIEITGIHPYDKDEIIDATGVKKGEYLYSIDDEEVEQKLLGEMRYLASVSVSKRFPNKLVIEVESRTARWYIDMADRKYALDSDLYVIEEINNTSGVTRLVLPNVTRAMAGEVPVFGKSETEVKRTLEIIQIVRTSSLRSRITELDVESRLDIRLVIDGKYEALLGKVADLEAKLTEISKMLENDEVKNAGSGTFYATSYPITFG